MSLLVYNDVLFGGTDTQSVWKMVRHFQETKILFRCISCISKPIKVQFRISVHTIFDDVNVTVHNLLGQEVNTAHDKFANGSFT